MKKHCSAIVETTQLKLVICNMCGADIDIMSNPYLDSYISIDKVWGYGSPHDGEHHSIDLCIDCYRNFLSTLKIAPDLQNSVAGLDF